MNVVIFATDHDSSSAPSTGPGIEQYATFEDAVFRLFLSKLSLVEQVFVREKQKTRA